MSRHLEDLVGKNGPLKQLESVPKEVITKYRNRLPEIIIEIWEEHGVGAWGGDTLRLCIPADFHDILYSAFGKDRELSPADCHTLGYSPFGTLLFWSERHWLGRVNLVNGHVRCPKLVNPESFDEYDSPEATLALALLDPKPKAIDVIDEQGRPLLAQARKRLGKLEPGECYGFVPALALGGAPELGAIKRMPAIEHFAILAQLQPFTLWDYLARPPGPVRDIG